jgi:hypothetical protein
VVTPEEEEVLGVLDLVGEHQANGLNRLFSPVDIVTQEEIVGLSGEAGVLEQFDEVWILAVDVA